MSKGTFAARCHLHGICSVAYTLGAPGYVWQSGAWTATITDTGTGDNLLTWGADYAIDSTQGAAFCQPNAAYAASGVTSIHVTFASDTTFRVTTGQEAALGAASVAADVAYFLQVWKFQP
jgi:hypothetical protein